MAAAPFTFQFFPEGALTQNESREAELSVTVEVIPEALSRAHSGGSADKAERDLAEQIAREAAEEVFKGEIPSKLGTVAQIGAVPEDLQNQAPTLQKNGVRVWLVDAKKSK